MAIGQFEFVASYCVSNINNNKNNNPKGTRTSKELFSILAVILVVVFGLQ